MFPGPLQPAVANLGSAGLFRPFSGPDPTLAMTLSKLLGSLLLPSFLAAILAAPAGAAPQ